MKPSDEELDRLRKEGFDWIIALITVCTDAAGKEVFRSADQTPHPDWDRGVLEESRKQDIRWMQEPDEMPRSWSWRARWSVDAEPPAPSAR